MRAPVEGWFDELGQRLANVTLDGLDPGATTRIGLELAGHPGSGWVLYVAEGHARLTRLDPGERAEDPEAAPAATLVVRDDLATQLVSGQVGVAEALAEGGIRIRGDARQLFAAEPVLAAVQRIVYEPSRSSSPRPSTEPQPEGGGRSQPPDSPHQAPETEPGHGGGELR